MIRRIARLILRRELGALRARVHEVEQENKTLGESLARVHVYNRNLNEECDRLATTIRTLEKPA